MGFLSAGYDLVFVRFIEVEQLLDERCSDASISYASG
jgi:hypothetical protein